MALALKKCGYATEICGWDLNERHRQEALELGLVDTISTEDRALQAELVIVAIPVDQAAAQIASYLTRLSDEGVLMDVGSTKQVLCRALSGHPRRSRFVATHPIAGTEFSGPSAASGGLFTDKISLICEAERSGPTALKRVRDLYQQLQMQVIEMDAQAHDLHMAYVSQLSHLSSFTLSNTILALEKEEGQISNLAGSGFASTVRLAKSAPDTWTAILLENRKNVLEALEAYTVQLEALRAILQAGRAADLRRYLEDANRIAAILKRI